MSNQTGAEPEAEVGPKPGEILAGKYRVERVIGQGGMGVVVAAEHTALRQPVAIKLLLPEAAKRPDATERFLREARAAVAIKNEHVARVMDVGTLDTGEPFMVMEHLVGGDFGSVIQKRGALPVSDAVDFILQACEAIAEAHALGIIHRDLKPANLFLTSRKDGSPLVKVLDFGLSKATQADSFEASLTQANTVMGSPFYMSPEQMRSLKGLTVRSDIWSLGVILYQLLAGSRPFEAEALADLFYKIGAEAAPPLQGKRSDVPPELEAAVMRCLEKDPAKRPQTIAELARSLAPFAPEQAKVSIERIHGLLGDDTLSGKRTPIAQVMPDMNALGQTVPLEVDENAATVALAAPPTPLPDAATTVPLVEKPSDKVSSGSMAALATPVAPTLAEPVPSAAPAAAEPRKKRGLAIGIAAVLVLVGVGAVAIRMRSPGADHGAAATPADPAVTTTAAAPPVVTATAAPEPSATAAQTAAPAETAAPADTAAPAASATAAPTAKPAPKVPKSVSPPRAPARPGKH